MLGSGAAAEDGFRPGRAERAGGCRADQLDADISLQIVGWPLVHTQNNGGIQPDTHHSRPWDRGVALGSAVSPGCLARCDRERNAGSAAKTY